MQQLPYHIKDLGGYIFFSENTQGISGSPVKIHTRLFLDFFCAVDPGSAEGQSVIRDIEALRVNPNAHQQITHPTPPPPKPERPAHQQQLRKINNTLCQLGKRQEMSRTTKNLVVYYHIHQLDGDKCPTVYISEIRLNRADTSSEAGLFKPVKLRTGATGYEKDSSLDLENYGVYVSKAVDQPREAFSIANDLGQQKPVKVFVNSAATANDLAIWHESRLTSRTAKLVHQLRDLIRQNGGKAVDWWLDGEGAAVFSKALKGLNVNLEKQNFKLINPRCNVSALLQELSSRKAQLNNEFITHFIDRKSLIALTSQTQQLSEQIRTLPGAKDGYNKIAYNYIANQINELKDHADINKLLTLNNSLRGSNKFFVAMLHEARKRKA